AASSLTTAADRNAVRSLSACGLGHLHIFKRASTGHRFELSQAMMKGNRAGPFMRSISTPSAKFGHNPGRPGKRAAAMRIFLELGLSLDVLIYRGERLDFFSGEHRIRRKRVAAAASLNE